MLKYRERFQQLRRIGKDTAVVEDDHLNMRMTLRQPVLAGTLLPSGELLNPCK